MRLATERLDLEPLRREHVALVLEPLLDERLWAYLDSIRPANAAEMQARLERWLAGPPPELRGTRAYLNWVGFERAPRAAVGAFQGTVFGDGTAWAGYIVFADHQRRGYAVEAMRAVFAHLRDAHGVRRIVADMNRRNTASIAVARRLGMTEVPSEHPADRAFVLWLPGSR